VGVKVEMKQTLLNQLQMEILEVLVEAEEVVVEQVILLL
tara:strand:+ start:234 stop:350 length:117 start_codon:yes stop_codon:yes gene_type:complete